MTRSRSARFAFLLVACAAACAPAQPGPRVPQVARLVPSDGWRCGDSLPSEVLKLDSLILFRLEKPEGEEVPGRVDVVLRIEDGATLWSGVVETAEDGSALIAVPASFLQPGPVYRFETKGNEHLAAYSFHVAELPKDGPTVLPNSGGVTYGKRPNGC